METPVFNKVIFNNLEKNEYRMREAYNSLRNNLQFCGADLKVFLLTSCSMNEGKSTIAFELAHSMADSGKKVIVVDADMRKSVMVNRYQMEIVNKEVFGFSHYLTKQCEAKDIINQTNIEGMDIILTGPLSPNPTELLEGEFFPELMANLKKEYDAVIIDSPPLGLVIDAAVMAPHCDGTILVIESDSTCHHMAKEVQKQLEVTGCRVLGAVLNKVDISKTGYYSYYRYYGKYGRYGKYKYYGYYGEYK